MEEYREMERKGNLSVILEEEMDANDIADQKRNVSFVEEEKQGEVESHNYKYTGGETYEEFAKANKLKVTKFEGFEYFRQCDNLNRDKDLLFVKLKKAYYKEGAIIADIEKYAMELKNVEVLEEKIKQIEQLEIHPKNYLKGMNICNKKKVIKRKELQKKVPVPQLNDELVLGYMLNNKELVNKLIMLLKFS
ncbi:MAG: hypothetical protein LBV51_03785 [Acholeplasmatales bacterium]|jgi:hypothetical protein|nr:hypothetical protein [Acholeplasmatales bacterium]